MEKTFADRTTTIHGHIIRRPHIIIPYENICYFCGEKGLFHKKCMIEAHKRIFINKNIPPNISDISVDVPKSRYL